MALYSSYFDTDTYYLLAEACQKLLFAYSQATISEDGFRSGLIACLADSNVPLPLISTPSNRSGDADVWIGETRIEVKYTHPTRASPLSLFDIATDLAEVAGDRCGFFVLGISMLPGEHAKEQPDKQHVRRLISLPGIPTESAPKCWYDQASHSLKSFPKVTPLDTDGVWFAPGVLLPVVHLAGSIAFPAPTLIAVPGSRGRRKYSYMIWKQRTAIDTKSILMLSKRRMLSCWVFGGPEIGRLVLMFTKVPASCVEMPDPKSWQPLSIQLSGGQAFDAGSVGPGRIKPERYYAGASAPIPIFSLC